MNKILWQWTEAERIPGSYSFSLFYYPTANKYNSPLAEWKLLWSSGLIVLQKQITCVCLISCSCVVVGRFEL